MRFFYLLTLLPIFVGLSVPVVAAPAFSSNPAAVRPGTYVLDPNHGKITWSLSHLGFSTYTGQFGRVNAVMTLDPGHLNKTSLSATVDIASISTLNPVLDSELRGPKFFDDQVHPEATFTSTKLVRTGLKTAELFGNLTMLGVTKPIILLVAFNQSGLNPIANCYVVGFEAHTVIQRVDFGLSAFVPFVGNEVTLDLEGEFDLRS